MGSAGLFCWFAVKILLTHRYFWPDTSPYGLILRALAEGLADLGHDVHVFTSRPSYGRGVPAAPRFERLGRVNIRRTWVFPEHGRNRVTRVINVLLYCGALFFHTLRTRADLVTAGTFPPVFAAWCASLGSRLVGSRFIYHVQDIHPELSMYSGGMMGRGLLLRFLRYLDNQSLRRAEVIVTLSEDMAGTLRARGLGELPIRVLNNPPLDAEAQGASPPAELLKLPGKRRVIFAGNLGRFQNLPLLAEGVAKCFGRYPDLELLFLGEGVALQELRSSWGNHPQVRFGPFLPFAQARELLVEAEVGLVSLNPNIHRVAYPSKLATYLDLGLKVLALVEPESQIARDLETSQVGAVPKASTSEAIGIALERILSMPKPNQNQAHVRTGAAGAWDEMLENASRQKS